MRISDWSSDVCSSDLRILRGYEEDGRLSIVPLDPVLDRERLAGVRQEPDGLRMGVQDCADRLSHFCRVRRYERVSQRALQALVDFLQAGFTKLVAKMRVRGAHLPPQIVAHLDKQGATGLERETSE